MITLKDVIKKYDRDFALKNVNLNIKKGSFVAITGESGSGKTTLLSILSTLLKPNSGEIVFEDTEYKEIKDIDKFRQMNIGFVFQFHYLINYLNVKENILLANEKASDKEIDELLTILEIQKLKNYYPNEISGGQRQRVAIARALINRPKVIFADEPTGNLDSKNSLNVFNLFKSLSNNGVTIVVATHDKELAKLADITLEVKDGQL
ncbi:peptide ABC transporter ATP-binding protein [Malaciobacter halophilus]|uniref:Peptide ABC transporter ATP-binding protein n=1 Tax=Malaciobacter halophilus TaxID=197482 RepID=A0A2N1J0P1_9BACT|nr:ABC transporter ATP-binding protein [Malaciobacter halophilus]AXH11023.1 ABC transporter, ATP-binding protein, FtsE/LolD family [Malaciobacter halophilus]PKI80120.1 peptide ABC transporter ATP-binding protein [Malaciobacter halophilus]